MKKPIIQESQIFLNDFFHEARYAKKRIWVETMFFEPGYIIDTYERIITKARARGIDVRFTIDWVTENYYDNHLRVFPSLRPKWRQWKIVHNDRVAFLERLKAIGVHVLIVHKPGLVFRMVPVKGRNHNKIYIVDDKAWMGGINFSSDLSSRDIMIKVFSPNIVSILVLCFLKAKRIDNDFTVTRNKKYTFFADAGIAYKSIILKEAIRCIAGATGTIIFISQFVPDMNVLFALVKKADEGIPVTIITGEKNETIFTKFPFNFFFLLFKYWVKKNKLINVFHYRGKIHAKLLLIDNTQVFIGSHNFIWSTVFLGTTEIALKITDPRIILDCSKFIRSLLAHTDKMER